MWGGWVGGLDETHALGTRRSFQLDAPAFPAKWIAAETLCSGYQSALVKLELLPSGDPPPENGSESDRQSVVAPGYHVSSFILGFPIGRSRGLVLASSLRSSSLRSSTSGRGWFKASNSPALLFWFEKEDGFTLECGDTRRGAGSPRFLAQTIFSDRASRGGSALEELQPQT